MPETNDQPKAWLLNDRFRLLIAFEIGLAGGLVAFALAHGLRIGADGTPTSLSPIFVALRSAIGGMVCGFCFSGWFGRPGQAGWLYALLASLLSPPLAGAVAGTLVVPVVGTLLGAYLALHSFVYWQPLLIWLLCLAILHLQTLYLRRKFPAPQLQQRG